MVVSGFENPLRKGNLPGSIWHGLGGDSLGVMAVKKNDVDWERSIDHNATKRATRINASNTWVRPTDGL
jgi:hypothetical protein